jgi:hypothetical protein
MINNALLEANASVPTVLHAGGGGGCPAPQRNITRPGRLGGGAIEFSVVRLLVLVPITNNIIFWCSRMHLSDTHTAWSSAMSYHAFSSLQANS